ncbi:MAG: hypothetical protein CFE29_24810 [Bradyrhizobiaceae bacterium PARB1]|jgi:hypothetical protein|nr:MAG: hypothetical protein CFE29_24810 [Bradyrhizobiaceae bacterium PARB1]
MTIGGWRISDVAALMAVVGLLAVLGAWDNARTIQRNLADGHPASAMITGAHQKSNRFPLTFDGLRPRLLDESYALDLAWRSADGEERMRQKVPVSGEFLATVMVGDKVRPVPVPIRVTDEADAVPTIVPDAAERLRRLDDFQDFFGTGALICAAIFAIGFGWHRWRRPAAVPVPPASAAAMAGAEDRPNQASRTWDIPPRLASLTALFLVSAGVLGWFNFTSSRNFEAIRSRGRDALATITAFHAEIDKDRHLSHTIELAWRDAAGTERQFRRTHISNRFAAQIAFNGRLMVRQIPIRYLEDDRSARPIIIGDADDQAQQNTIGFVFTLIFGALGLLFAAITAWRMRRSARQAMAAPAHEDAAAMTDARADPFFSKDRQPSAKQTATVE